MYFRLLNVNHGAMYIESVPNRSSPPAILLRESFRENGRVRKRTLANLSDWPTTLVEGFRTLLKGGVAVAEEGIAIRRALPHGHAAAVLGTIRAIGLDRLLGKPTDKRLAPLTIALIASRLVSPASKLATARDLAADTACSSLVAARCGRRSRTLPRARLAGRAPGRDRRRARPPPPQGRCAGALRRLLVLAGGPVLRAGALRLLAGRQEGQAADRLRSAVCGRRLPGRGRGVRRQYRRPDDIVGANRQAQRALRLVTRRAGRRSRHDHQRPHPRRAEARRARLDHRAASPADPRFGRRRRLPALAVRRARSGRDHRPRFPWRTSGRLPQPAVGRGTHPQARGSAARHRGGVDQAGRSDRPRHRPHGPG